jgi:hypothetical protein
VAVNWQRLSAALGALTAIATAMGGSGVYLARTEAADEAQGAVKARNERRASVALLESLSAAYVRELRQAEAREARCWAVLHPGAVAEALENEAAPTPATPADLSAALDAIELAEPAAKPPKLERLQRYEWWDELPPEVQAIVPGAVEPEPTP